MTEKTLAEIDREVGKLATQVESKVSREVFDIALANLIADLQEVKAWQQRMTWALIGNFAGLVVGLIVFLLNQTRP